MRKYLLPLGLAGLVLFEGCNAGAPPPPATHFSVSPTANAVAGTPFNVTVTALDASNSVASGYSGTVHFSSSDARATLPGDSMLTRGTGSFPVTFKTAGGQSITVSDSSISGSSNSVTVAAASVSQLFVITPGTPTYVGVAFNITVNAMDAYNNTTSSYSGTVQFKSSDTQAVLPAPSVLANGTGTFSVTLKTAGNQTITATDTFKASITGVSSQINIQVVGPLLITSGPPPNGVVGQGYGGSHTITGGGCTMTVVGWPLSASGGISGYKWSWAAAPGSALPAGLTLVLARDICSPGFGVFAEIIKGTPTTTGTYNVIVTVADAATPPNQTSVPYSISILGAAAANEKAVGPGQGKSGHHHYVLVDFGSLGGPGGGIVYPSSRALNNRGMGIGASDTANPDPFAPDCYLDCNVVRGQFLRNGVVTELPPLSSAPSVSSIPAGINIWGQAVGSAQNGLVDSATGWPESHGVLWENNQTIEIPTLGGTQSIANDINDFGFVAGASLTTTPDPFANSQLCGDLPTTCGTFAMTATFFPGTTESHAFLWHRGGFLRDLGTLGGPDSAGWVTNNLGEVAGWSFTSFEPNPATGVPTVDPFFWSPVTGRMVDIGGFGGTFGAAFWMNDLGQVVGSSNLAGDNENHAFFWDHGKLTDLGTLGGGFSQAFSVNDAGEVVGTSDSFAFAWKDGVMRDLGTVDGDECSAAFSINSLSQIVGVSASCSTNTDLHGFLGENGGLIVDLNPLIVPASHPTVVTAVFINDRGEIACLVQESDGSNNGCHLIPCDENHPNIVGCDYSMVESGVAEAASLAPIEETAHSGETAAKAGLSGLTPAEQMLRMRSILARRRRP